MDIRKPKFKLLVQDIFNVAGMGVVVTGPVTEGAVRVGDIVNLIKSDGSKKSCRIKQIEGFRKVLQEALLGDNIGLLLEGVEKSDINTGDNITFE